jgi:hypothetical protein
MPVRSRITGSPAGAAYSRTDTPRATHVTDVPLDSVNAPAEDAAAAAAIVAPTSRNWALRIRSSYQRIRASRVLRAPLRRAPAIDMRRSP